MWHMIKLSKNYLFESVLCHRHLYDLNRIFKHSQDIKSHDIKHEFGLKIQGFQISHTVCSYIKNIRKKSFI